MALPFRVQLVVFFFAFDALEKAALLSGLVSAGSPLMEPGHEGGLPLVLALLFDLLLVVMLVLRTRAGRFWALLYLVALSGVGLALLCLEPQRWLHMSLAGRVREMGSHAASLLLCALLLSARARLIFQR